MSETPRRNAATVGGVLAVVVAMAMPFLRDLENGPDKPPVLTPYRDSTRTPTVCSGITGSQVVMGRAWTREQCDAEDARVVTREALVVMQCIYVDQTLNQWTALITLAHNIGEHRLCDSTLARRVNAGDTQGVVAEWWRWINSGGSPDPGLYSRRAAEVQCYLRPDAFGPCADPRRESLPARRGFAAIPQWAAPQYGSVIDARPSVPTGEQI